MEKIKQIQKEKMQSLKALKASILDKAFKGEL
jgi:type I restriction enzyme S subunit